MKKIEKGNQVKEKGKVARMITRVLEEKSDLTSTEIYKIIIEKNYDIEEGYDSNNRIIIHTITSAFSLLRDDPNSPYIVRKNEKEINIYRLKDILKEEKKISQIPIIPNLERMLEDVIVKNLEYVEEGLTVYEKNGVSGRQYRTEVGIIDILCVDRNKNFVIIEDKRDKSSDNVVGQTTRYMGCVKATLAGNKKTRGIIISQGANQKLRYAASVIDNLEVKNYEISLKFVVPE